jgi:hypothetical protein
MVEAGLSGVIVVFPKSIYGDAVAWMRKGTVVVRAECPSEAYCQVAIMFHSPDKIDQDRKKSALQSQGTTIDMGAPIVLPWRVIIHLGLLNAWPLLRAFELLNMKIDLPVCY